MSKIIRACGCVLNDGQLTPCTVHSTAAKIAKALKVKNVVVEIECEHCNGRGRIPGGKYQAQGEVINCPFCNGRKVVRSSITLSMFYDLLMGNLRASSDDGGGK